VLLAGVKDGAADLVAALGHIDDGKRDSNSGGRRPEVVGRQEEAVRDRRRVRRGQVEHVLHGGSEEEGTHNCGDSESR
jgi:hypothetical protein